MIVQLRLTAVRQSLSNYWASDPNGIDQVGCVYTAQGFECDCAGVIWGRDSCAGTPPTNEWLGDPSHSQDPIVNRSGDRFTDLVKRTYRVLLSPRHERLLRVLRRRRTRDKIAFRFTGRDRLPDTGQMENSASASLEVLT